MINIYGKEINIKNYDCSRDGINYPKLPIPVIALYVQVINRCNAKCSFCDFGKVCDMFDYDKFEGILKELRKKVYVSKICITGGEPLLDTNRTINVIKIARKYSKKIVLNTNAFSLERLKIVYPYVDEIDISRHHYNEEVHKGVLKTEVATLEEIAKIDVEHKITINCVMQKGRIESYDEVMKFVNYIAKNNIKSIKFISLLPLTKEAESEYVNPSSIIEECKKYTNSGMLYDYHMCNCFEFIYLSYIGNVVKVTIRNTTDSCYSCVKQLVFNGENLFDGFKKETKII